jgi:hypothetical protein
MAQYEAGSPTVLKTREAFLETLLNAQLEAFAKSRYLILSWRTDAGRLRGDLSGQMQNTDLDHKELK